VFKKQFRASTETQLPVRHIACLSEPLLSVSLSFYLTILTILPHLHELFTHWITMDTKGAGIHFVCHPTPRSGLPFSLSLSLSHSHTHTHTPPHIQSPVSWLHICAMQNNHRNKVYCQFCEVQLSKGSIPTSCIHAHPPQPEYFRPDHRLFPHNVLSGPWMCP